MFAIDTTTVVLDANEVIANEPMLINITDDSYETGKFDNMIDELQYYADHPSLKWRRAVYRADHPESKMQTLKNCVMGLSACIFPK